ASRSKRSSNLRKIMYAAGSLPIRRSRGERRMSLFVFAEPNQRNALPDRIHVLLDRSQCMLLSEGASFGMPLTRALSIPPQAQRDTPSDETPSKIENMP